MCVGVQTAVLPKPTLLTGDVMDKINGESGTIGQKFTDFMAGKPIWAFWIVSVLWNHMGHVEIYCDENISAFGKDRVNLNGRITALERRLRT
jgi:hypothetical protein